MEKPGVDRSGIRLSQYNRAGVENGEYKQNKYSHPEGYLDLVTGFASLFDNRVLRRGATVSEL
jgi:hypothetical protein